MEHIDQICRVEFQLQFESISFFELALVLKLFNKKKNPFQRRIQAREAAAAAALPEETRRRQWNSMRRPTLLPVGTNEVVWSAGRTGRARV